MMKSARSNKAIKSLASGGIATILALLATLLLVQPAAALASAEESSYGTTHLEGPVMLPQVDFLFLFCSGS